MATFYFKLKQNDSDVERKDFLSISSDLQLPLPLRKDRKALSQTHTHTHTTAAGSDLLEGKNFEPYLPKQDP